MSYFVDDITVNPPAETFRRVLTFSGAVSDIRMEPYGAESAVTVKVAAADIGADLGNRVIGDAPWVVQTLGTRADRICQLAGITTSPRIRIDAPLDALQVSYRDVDAQPSYQLLQDLAQTGGGVLWAATHRTTGPFLYIENPANRVSVRELTLSGGVIVIAGTTEDGVVVISACDIREDGVAWLQDTGDVSTVVAVTWLLQGVGDDGQPETTEQTVTVTDLDAVAIYGTRRLSVSTELINAPDATELADRFLAQSRGVGWRLEGLTFDTGAMNDVIPSVDDGTRQDGFLTLLDGTSRMGAALTLVDMPGYAPRGSVSSAYLEGGTYAFRDGFWALELRTTPAVAQGTGATWAELDAAWTWAQWSPSIEWVDLFGVAA
jgi:hypothetical protein